MVLIKKHPNQPAVFGLISFF